MAYFYPSAKAQAQFHSVPTSDSREEGDDAVKSPLAGELSDNIQLPRRRHRRLLSLSVLGAAALDMLLAITALYFIAFGLLAYRYRGAAVEDRVVVALLRAARLGPTILPIMFAGIVGRFLTAIAAWRLEHGVAIGGLEYLLGGRTVFSVITTPIRLRTVHCLAPLLIVVWALSPLGGQANLRVVSRISTTSNGTAEIRYFDTLSPTLIEGASGWDNIGLVIQTAFIGAMTGPLYSKRAPMDLYDNVKIPLLESLSRSRQPDPEGWYTMPSADERVDISYSALTGIPIGIGEKLTKPTMAQYHIESSYMYPDCELYEKPSSGRLHSIGTNSFYDPIVEPYEPFAISLYENVTLLSPGDSLDQQSRARTIAMKTRQGDGPQNWYWYGAQCTLTTTYVETAFSCDANSCRATRIRESRESQFSKNITALDGFSRKRTDESIMNRTVASLSANIQSRLLSALNMGINPDYLVLAPLENYFYNPGTPLRLPERGHGLFTMDANTISERYAQILNTYWSCHSGAYGLTGNTSFLSDNAFLQGNLTLMIPAYVRNSTATTFTNHTVLDVDRVWLAVLLLSGSVMFFAALGAALLGMLRRGPEILDCFVSTLRDSPYASDIQAGSTEDGTDMAKRLRHKVVMLGDVEPEKEAGKIAISTVSEKRHVQRLRSQRLYS